MLKCQTSPEFSQSEDHLQSQPNVTCVCVCVAFGEVCDGDVLLDNTFKFLGLDGFKSS